MRRPKHSLDISRPRTIVRKAWPTGQRKPGWLAVFNPESHGTQEKLAELEVELASISSGGWKIEPNIDIDFKDTETVKITLCFTRRCKSRSGISMVVVEKKHWVIDSTLVSKNAEMEILQKTWQSGT